MSEKQLTNKELFKIAMVLEAAGNMLADVDLNALQARLRTIEHEAETESPLTLSATRDHLHHLMRLADVCRPVQEEMARAPRPKEGLSGYHALSA